MTTRDRILEAAMQVFRRHGFRRSSIEQAAEAAGLTRQALYHHFSSKEALFRAAIERVHEAALATGAEAAARAEAAGHDLADVLIGQITARLKALVAALDGSPHVEELLSEHLAQARDLYQDFAARHQAALAATIARVRTKQKLQLNPGMTPSGLARYVEMAVNGAKSAHPNMQPLEAFLRDLSLMVRTLVAGAITNTPKSATLPRKRPAARRKTGDRK